MNFITNKFIQIESKRSFLTCSAIYDQFCELFHKISKKTVPDLYISDLKNHQIFFKKCQNVHISATKPPRAKRTKNFKSLTKR